MFNVPRLHMMLVATLYEYRLICCINILDGIERSDVRLRKR